MGTFAKNKVGESKRRQGILQTMLQVLPVEGEREGADLGGGKSLQLQPNSKKVLARLMGNPPQLASREAPVSQEGPRVPTRLSPWLEQPLGSGVLVGTWWIHSVMLPTARNLSSTL